jgi:oxygen-independent coproporphyrinogen-3 oxidase
LATGGDGLVERLTGAHAAKEGLWLGLRRLAGFDLTSFLRAFPGVDRAWIHQRLAQPLARGLLVVEDDVVRLAPGAWLHHDAVGAHVLR